MCWWILSVYQRRKAVEIFLVLSLSLLAAIQGDKAKTVWHIQSKTNEIGMKCNDNEVLLVFLNNIIVMCGSI